jgi:hypothetical protein
MDWPDPSRWLNAAESAKAMNIPEQVFRYLVRRGVIPPPVEITRKTKLWPSLTIFCCSQLLGHLRQLAGEDESDESGPPHGGTSRAK